MASTNLTHSTIEHQTKAVQQEASDQEDHDFKELILSLPRENGWITPDFTFFQGFWCVSTLIQPIITFQKQFQAKDSDILVATLPKSGTTWLKALTFAITNRQRFSPLEDHHPLLKSNSHELVPFLEINFYGQTLDGIPQFDMSKMTEPRIFGTHIPFNSLAKSIKDSKCKIIYICRNPFDTFVSQWIFLNKIKPEELPEFTLEEAFERYCKGVTEYGPTWDHMLGYLKESVARPNKVLFLKYEDLKEDVNFHVKRIFEFLGVPFTQEEESGEVVENIIKLCSFEKMKDLEVNKSGTLGLNFEKKYFFRKAEIGDWVNYLSPSMVEKLSKIMEEKLSGSGLSFRSD
uniref:Sulfotransferase n=1 Tax=Lotus japonicus TaxID=34305 RepID=I3STZ9_LOTJA|nr:unknown [Lotus japonicus]